MNFFDIKPESLPRGAQYYFNIAVVVIGFNNKLWQKVTEDISIQGLEHIWYIDQLTDPEPMVTCLYYDRELDQDTEFEVEVYPHKVVELFNNDVAWYNMIDFDTDDPWSLNGQIKEGMEWEEEYSDDDEYYEDNDDEEEENEI